VSLYATAQNFLEKSVNELKTLRVGGFDWKVLSRVLVEVILEGRG